MLQVVEYWQQLWPLRLCGLGRGARSEEQFLLGYLNLSKKIVIVVFNWVHAGCR